MDILSTLPTSFKGNFKLFNDNSIIIKNDIRENENYYKNIDNNPYFEYKKPKPNSNTYKIAYELMQKGFDNNYDIYILNIPNGIYMPNNYKIIDITDTHWILKIKNN